MSKKLGLALGSGGGRGVAHLGVLRALEEEGIKPDFISGSSMGAVVGAGYADGLSIDEMLEIVLKLKTVDILDISAVPVTKLGLLKGNKVHKLLLQNLGDVTFDKLKIPFCCVACDILSGKLLTLNEGKVATAVQASSAMPTVFRPVRQDKMLLVDGGVLCRVPVKQVKDMGADVVVAVDVLCNTREPVDGVSNIITKILRVYDIMDSNQSSIKKELEKDCWDVWLEPEMKGMSQYSVKELDRAYREGYECAKANMDKIKEFLK